jgi:hypothetical protein
LKQRLHECRLDEEQGRPTEQIGFPEATLEGGRGGIDWTTIVTDMPWHRPRRSPWWASRSLVLRLRRRSSPEER